MKKTFLMAFAALGLVACMQEEVVIVPQTDAITFEGAYVNNATRAAADPSTTTASITGFDVWAFMNESNGTVLVDEDVKKAGNTWGYANTQYWTPNNDYYFAALAPMNSANVTETLATGDEAKLGLGVVEFTNVDGSEDLLYAKAYVHTPRYADLKLNNMPPVKFQFQHLLSKVKFTFTNGFLTDNAYVEVLDVQMTAPKAGTINLAQADYATAWELNGTETYAYGNVEKLGMSKRAECAQERLTIPAAADQVYEVTFTVKLYMGEQLALETTKTATVTGIAVEMGKAYNLTAEITPDNLDLPAIEFDVVVEEWDQYGPTIDHEVGAYKDETGTKYLVATADGLAQVAEEINAGEFTGNVELLGDIDLANFTLTKSSVVESNWTPIGTSAEPFTGVFDGNGYTIKNLVIDGGSNSNIGFFGVTQNGEIKNVTFENAKVSGRLNVGVVSGTPYTSKYTNITVKGHVEVDGMAYVGAVGGKNAYANWTNITVNVDETSYVNANSVENGTAYRTYVGGVVGFNGEGGHSFTNITSNINVKGSTCDVGGLFGIAHYGNKFENCVCTGNVEIYAAEEEADAQEIGGIAGVWHPGGADVVMNNCSFTGTLKANNDFVINTTKFGNLVCSAYNTTGKGKLVIDGISYSAAEVAKTPVSTGEELVAALAAGESVIFLNDITLAATKGGYNKAGILQNKAQTIDGAGHTLKVTGAGATWDCAIYTNGGVIRNLTVAGAMRGIFTAGQSTDLHIDKVEFKGVIYTFNSDGKMPATPYGVYVSNSAVNGWTSHSNMHTEVVYTNCSFGEGSGYKYCRPYGTTKFVNCTFCAGYTVDKSQTTNLTFTDCIWE